MIILDFKVDERELALSLEERIEDEDETFFNTTMFVMPLRMRLNDLEIFETNEANPWSLGPVMDLASEGLAVIKDLKRKRKEEHLIIEGPGRFIFTMIDDENVYIEFTGGYVTTVKYNDLLEAFERYSEKVRTFLKERVPQINDHYYWGPWLRDEPGRQTYLG